MNRGMLISKAARKRYRMDNPQKVPEFILSKHSRHTSVMIMGQDEFVPPGSAKVSGQFMLNRMPAYIVAGLVIAL
jgi:hypothetical protein